MLCARCGSKVELYRPRSRVRFGNQEAIAIEDEWFDADSGSDAEGAIKPLPPGILRQPRGDRAARQEPPRALPEESAEVLLGDSRLAGGGGHGGAGG